MTKKIIITLIALSMSTSIFASTPELKILEKEINELRTELQDTKRKLIVVQLGTKIMLSSMINLIADSNITKAKKLHEKHYQWVYKTIGFVPLIGDEFMEFFHE